MKKCNKCKKDNLDDAQYCKFCGAPLEKTMYCPNCGKANSSNDVFCDNCGTKIGGKRKSKTKGLLLVGTIVLLLVVIIIKWQSGKTSLDENNNDIKVAALSGMGKGAIAIGNDNGYMANSSAVAFHCEDCKTVIIQYGNSDK